MTTLNWGILGTGRIAHTFAGLAVSQPTLDDVFLKYTGRRIRTEAADQPIILGW